MWKIGLTVIVTATVCFAIAAATGSALTGTLYTLKVGDKVQFSGDRFQCEVITKQEVACGDNALANSVQVYFAPKDLAVIKFGKTPAKQYKQLYGVGR